MPGTVSFISAIAEPPGGDHRGLHIMRRRAHVAFGIDRVENLADDMEGRGHVGAAVADEKPHRLADIAGDGLVAGGRADGAVEHDVIGPLVDGLDHAEGLQALLAIGALGVEVALHHVIFVIDLGQAFLRLDQDHARTCRWRRAWRPARWRNDRRKGPDWSP